MRRARVGIVVGLAVAALALAGCGGGDDEASGTTETDTTTTTTTTSQMGGETGTVLKGSVGPGFEISLTTEDGQPVDTLAPGSYTLLTDDKSDIHNFHLSGDGVDVSTDVGGTGPAASTGRSPPGPTTSSWTRTRGRRGANSRPTAKGRSPGPARAARTAPRWLPPG